MHLLHTPSSAATHLRMISSASSHVSPRSRECSSRGRAEGSGRRPLGALAGEGGQERGQGVRGGGVHAAVQARQGARDSAQQEGNLARPKRKLPCNPPGGSPLRGAPSPSREPELRRPTSRAVVNQHAARHVGGEPARGIVLLRLGLRTTTSCEICPSTGRGRQASQATPSWPRRCCSPTGWGVRAGAWAASGARSGRLRTCPRRRCAG